MKTNNSKDVAIALINKMIEYQRNIDKKENPTPAEVRHVNILRTIIKTSK